MKKISIIIASKNKTNKKLKECLRSIKIQDYPRDRVEVLVITEGTPESAKAIGLKKATGDIICFMASDCEFTDTRTLSDVAWIMEHSRVTGAYSGRYFYDKSDPILNRYFALFGCNDPIPLYLGKCDRGTYYVESNLGFLSFPKSVPTLGDNGFFIQATILRKADIKHYSHIDVCEDLRKLGYYEYYRLGFPIHHKTGDSLWLWIKKRFHYAESLNENRRWKMVGSAKDVLGLMVFVLLTLTVVEPILRSVYGYVKSGIRDKAWFLHPIICFITLWVYGALCVKQVLSYAVRGVRKS